MIKNKFKKMKSCCIKTKKLLVKYEIVTKSNLQLTKNGFWPIFIETMQKLREKNWQSSKIHRHFLKTNIVKVVRDIR